MRRILVCGATSAIVGESLKHFASDGDALMLVGRSHSKLAAIAADLRTRGASKVEARVADLADITGHAAIVDESVKVLGGLDVLYIGWGTLGDQKASQDDVEVMAKELHNNFVAPAALVAIVANRFEEAGSGTIAVISSVAGDRGRKSNYVYGTAKGALSTFLQGVRQRLSRSGVAVVTIKPGFVDTPMTASFKKGPLFASPAKVGRDIYRGIVRGRDMVYTPWFWWAVMFIIRLVPESIFKKTSI